MGLVSVQDNKAITTSIMVADSFGKQHKDVLKSIYNLECSKEFYERNFALILKTSELGMNRTRQDKAFSMTRDGFTFLAMGYTGLKASQFKEAYINAFNEMEASLSKPKQGFTVMEVLNAMSAERKEIEDKISGLNKRLREINTFSSTLMHTTLPKSLSAGHVVDIDDENDLKDLCLKIFGNGESLLYNEFIKKIQANICVGGNKARLYVTSLIKCGLVSTTKVGGGFRRYSASGADLFNSIAEDGRKTTWHLGIFSLAIGDKLYFDSSRIWAMKQHVLRYKRSNPNGMRFLVTTRGTPPMKFSVKRLK